MAGAVFRWNFEEYWEWPRDLRRMDLHAKRAIGEAIVDILDEMKARSLSVYRNEVYGDRIQPTKYRGTWGASLRTITRGTGLTAGQAYGILQDVASYAQDLSTGRRSGDLVNLEVWAKNKLGLSDDQAVRFAARMYKSMGLQAPYPDIFETALGPGSGFQIWADNLFRDAMDRVMVAGGRV